VNHLTVRRSPYKLKPVASFSLPWRFIAKMTEGGAGVSHEFWTASLDEVARFGDHSLQKVRKFADPGFAVDYFRC